MSVEQSPLGSPFRRRQRCGSVGGVPKCSLQWVFKGQPGPHNDSIYGLGLRPERKTRGTFGARLKHGRRVALGEVITTSSVRSSTGLEPHAAATVQPHGDHEV